MTELRIMGSAGYTFPALSNEEVLMMLGRPRSPEWVCRMTGIKGHSLNLDPETLKKKTLNVTAVDYAEWVARKALADAGLKADDIDQLVFCTCTPAQLHFWADAIELHRRLKLRTQVVILQVDGGCAALAQAFQAAESQAKNASRWNVLVVASNDVISHFEEQYLRVKGAWLSPLMFADGAAALVLGSSGRGPRLAGTYCAYDGDHPLVTYRGGGGLVPTRLDTIDEHVYLMQAKDVAVQFVPAMLRVWEYFRQRFGLEVGAIKRWYFHQANLRLIERLARELAIPPERIPANVDRFGNTVSASTILLLDEDRKSGAMSNPFIFMWVGAGMVEGGALFL